MYNVQGLCRASRRSCLSHVKKPHLSPFKKGKSRHSIWRALEQRSQDEKLPEEKNVWQNQANPKGQKQLK